MKVNLSQVKWQTDEIVIDGKHHNRAVAIINGKNVCIVRQMNSDWCTAWVGEVAEVVHKENLSKWISYYVYEE